MIFGGFIEHFDRQIYGGVFEPGSPLSDEKGFRKDVIAAMKELKLSIVRWPGGCFASGYHWKDGVGKNRKPARRPGLGRRRSEHLRHRRVRRVVPARRLRALYLHQCRQRHARGDAGLGRVLQRDRGPARRTAHGRRPRQAAQRPLLEHRQRELGRPRDRRAELRRSGDRWSSSRRS